MSLHSDTIILIPSHPVFALTPLCCVLSGEATNNNLKVFGLTRPGLKPTIYRTRGEHANHYTTDAVLNNVKMHDAFKIFLSDTYT